MSENKNSVSARGPIRYDLTGMTDTDFELLCHRLVRIEHPDVVKPAESGDGGVDALLPKPGGGYAHGWQSKHFPGRMRWDKCRKSFCDARENYKPERYTFCFPRNLTKTEQQTFDKHFRGEDAEIPVDYWSGDEIQARLTETERGQTIAKHFFKDDGETLAEIKRAVEAKGSLDTPHDALQRMKPIGEYLAAGDPYFTYAGSVYGDGAETEPPEGAVMSVSESGEGITSRIDVVPNDPEAMELHGPRGKMILPVEAYRRAQEDLARGKDFTFEGVEVIWEQLPPAFSGEVDRPRRADVTIGPVHRLQPAPWDARLTVENEGARAQFDVDLRRIDPPHGWDGALEGLTAGLTVRLLVRRVGSGGQGELKYNYSLARDPARRQLEVLRFLDLAAAPGGTVRIVDRWRGSERQTTFETGATTDTNRPETLSAFLGWVVEIEDWTGHALPVGPDQFNQENFEALGQIAGAINRGGFNVTISEIEFLADPGASSDDLHKSGPIVIRRDLTVDLLGKTIPLGPSQIVLEGYKIEELGLDPKGRRRLRLRPEGEAPTTLMERIGKPKKAKRPPPPPARKNRRRRGRSRRKRGR